MDGHSSESAKDGSSINGSASHSVGDVSTLQNTALEVAEMLLYAQQHQQLQAPVDDGVEVDEGSLEHSVGSLLVAVAEATDAMDAAQVWGMLD
jgi:hypothetical protein